MFRLVLMTPVGGFAVEARMFAPLKVAEFANSLICFTAASIWFCIVVGSMPVCCACVTVCCSVAR
ncbi:MAG: hypothetical protein WDN49_12175 [Acetobacteraceae bacterium]